MSVTVNTKQVENSANIYHLAILLHNKYQELAHENKWEVQVRTNVSFENLPIENKRVMLDLAEWLIDCMSESGFFNMLMSKYGNI